MFIKLTFIVSERSIDYVPTCIANYFYYLKYYVQKGILESLLFYYATKIHEITMTGLHLRKTRT